MGDTMGWLALAAIWVSGAAAGAAVVAAHMRDRRDPLLEVRELARRDRRRNEDRTEGGL